MAFLDNLFLNLPVAHACLALDIGVMGTTRKNSKGVLDELVELKERKQALLYGGYVAIIKDGILCFAWQDNNIVLGITTSFSVNDTKDFIIRDRRRPGDASTNARIALPIFGNEWTKRLPIPVAIDAYNHHMNAVDVGNQLRSNFSCHLKFERRNWRPLAWWLLDVCLVNSFIIWRAKQPSLRQHSSYLREQFERQLIDSLVMRGLDHRPETVSTRRRCAWGIRHPEDCQQGANDDKTERQKRRITRRQPLVEITNESQPVKRSKNVNTRCISCRVWLCVKRGCFYKWHEDLRGNLIYNCI